MSPIHPPLPHNLLHALGVGPEEALTVLLPTPKSIVQRISDEVRKATQQADVQARVAAMGFEIKDSSPEAFAAVYKQELPVWERLIKQSGAKLE